jgi:hypothetical protein
MRWSQAESGEAAEDDQQHVAHVQDSPGTAMLAPEVSSVTTAVANERSGYAGRTSAAST